MKAAFQPQKAMMKATMGGATAAPITNPRFCSDIACAYSIRGNHLLIRTDAAGQVTASARPNGMRNKTNPAKDVAKVVKARRMHHSHKATRYVSRGLSHAATSPAGIWAIA